MQIYNWLKVTIAGYTSFMKYKCACRRWDSLVPPSHRRLFFLNRNRWLRVVLQPAISSLRGSRWITVACIFSTWCYNSRGWTKTAAPQAIYSHDICTPSDKRGLAALRSHCSFRKENDASPCHRVRHFCRLASSGLTRATVTKTYQKR